MSRRQKYSKHHSTQTKELRIILWLVVGLAVGLLIVGLWFLNRLPHSTD